MREDDGRKLDHRALEQLRIRAVGQVEQGTHPDDVAQALGMTRSAVYAWLAKYREGGLEASKARPVSGRPPGLSGAQLARLYGLVVGDDPCYHAGTTRAPVGRPPVDGHPVHRFNAVKAFAASTGGRLRLCFLPGSSPGAEPGRVGVGSTSSTISPLAYIPGLAVDLERQGLLARGLRPQQHGQPAGQDDLDAKLRHHGPPQSAADGRCAAGGVTCSAGLRGSLPSPDTAGKIQPLQPGLGRQEGGRGRASAAALQ